MPNPMGGMGGPKPCMMGGPHMGPRMMPGPNMNAMNGMIITNCIFILRIYIIIFMLLHGSMDCLTFDLVF